MGPFAWGAVLVAGAAAAAAAVLRRAPSAAAPSPPAVDDALRRSEETFRAVLEGSAAAVFLIEDGRIRYANAAASALTAVPVADLLDRSFLDRFHAHSHDVVRHRVLRAPSP